MPFPRDLPPVSYTHLIRQGPGGLRLIDKNKIAEALRFQHRRLCPGRCQRRLRHPRKMGVPLRAVGRLGDGPSEPGGTHHTEDPVCLRRDHRFMGSVGIQGTVGGAVRLRQYIVKACLLYTSRCV